MKRFFLAGFFFLNILFVTGQNGVTIVDSILSGGIQRKFRLYIPNIYNSNTSVPLILNLHGYTSNATQQQFYSNFMPIADTANFIIVHPEGTAPLGNQYWNAGFGSGANDVQFLSNLIDSIKASYNINLDEVYSCGMSNGGIMSYYLACNLSNRIAAIASVTGSMLNTWLTGLPTPPRPFPVMEIHGTSDGTVPYNGDGTFAPIDSVIKKWRVYNNCNSAPVTFSVPNINTSDNCTAINYKYTGGTNGSSVELYKITGGSHSWPGAANVIANTNQDFSASIEIWRFFRQYKLSQFIIPASLQKNFSLPIITVFPNPAKELITINDAGSSTITGIQITDVSGNQMKTESFGNTITITDLPAGVYVLKINSKNSPIRYSKFIKVN